MSAAHDLCDYALLGVFAHPDDESLACGGLLALCAERGARVSLLCLTRGERGAGTSPPTHGKGPPEGASEALGDRRERELREAARVLGVADVVLLDHEDGMLPWIDAARLESDISDAIRRLAPNVVVTFDEDGLYWHPDHVAVHERTTAAVAGLGAAGPALRYASLPAGAIRSLVEAGGVAARRSGLLGVADVDAFGAEAPTPTLVLDVASHAGRKLDALRCHRTQVEGSALDAVDERDAQRFLGREHFRRADVGSPGDSLLERLGTGVALRSE